MQSPPPKGGYLSSFELSAPNSSSKAFHSLSPISSGGAVGKMSLYQYTSIASISPSMPSQKSSPVRTRDSVTNLCTKYNVIFKSPELKSKFLICATHLIGIYRKRNALMRCTQLTRAFWHWSHACWKSGAAQSHSLALQQRAKHAATYACWSELAFSCVRKHLIKTAFCKWVNTLHHFPESKRTIQLVAKKWLQVLKTRCGRNLQFRKFLCFHTWKQVITHERMSILRGRLDIYERLISRIAEDLEKSSTGSTLFSMAPYNPKAKKQKDNTADDSQSHDQVGKHAYRIPQKVLNLVSDEWSLWK